MATEEQEKTRAQRIWGLEQEGYSKKEISDIIGVDESTIYREKRKPDYIEILVANRSAYLAGIKRMEESGQATIEAEAVKERGRMERSGSKLLAQVAMKQMETEQLTPEEETAKWHRDMKTKEHQFNVVLKIQQWQWKRLELEMKGEPYDHIDKNWTPSPSLHQDVPNHR